MNIYTHFYDSPDNPDSLDSPDNPMMNLEAKYTIYIYIYIYNDSDISYGYCSRDIHSYVHPDSSRNNPNNPNNPWFS